MAHTSVTAPPQQKALPPTATAHARPRLHRCRTCVDRKFRTARDLALHILSKHGQARVCAASTTTAKPTPATATAAAAAAAAAASTAPKPSGSRASKASVAAPDDACSVTQSSPLLNASDMRDIDRLLATAAAKNAPVDNDNADNGETAEGQLNATGATSSSSSSSSLSMPPHPPQLDAPVSSKVAATVPANACELGIPVTISTLKPSTTDVAVPSTRPKTLSPTRRRRCVAQIEQQALQQHHHHHQEQQHQLKLKQKHVRYSNYQRRKQGSRDGHRVRMPLLARFDDNSPPMLGSATCSLARSPAMGATVNKKGAAVRGDGESVGPLAADVYLKQCRAGHIPLIPMAPQPTETLNFASGLF